MKFKSLIITLLASSIFLTIIICIWKILATLQGLSFTNLNFNLNLFLSLGLVITCVFIGKKFNHNLKIFILSLLFTILYTFLNENSPTWFSVGIFLLILFFTNKLKKYDLKYLNQDFISEKIVFEFLSLFAIIFFALTLQKSAIFSFSFSGIGTSDRQTKISGLIPIDRNSLTEC